MTFATCPHCGCEVQPASLARHKHSCYARPGVYDAVRAAMDHPDKPNTAISLDAYRAIASARGLPSYEALRKQLGSWDQICAWAGLKPGQRHGYAKGSRPQKANREAQAIAETDEALARDAELRDWWETRGLEVCRVRVVGAATYCELR